MTEAHLPEHRERLYAPTVTLSISMMQALTHLRAVDIRRPRTQKAATLGTHHYASAVWHRAAGVPCRTLINGYILYLLLAKKGKRIFEDDYPAIVAATPDVKHRTSVVTWIALGILVLLLVGIVVALQFR